MPNITIHEKIGYELSKELNTNSYDYYLVDSRSRRFPVYYDGVLTHVLNHEIVSNTCKCRKRYDFYDEKEKDIIKIVNNN